MPVSRNSYTAIALFTKQTFTFKTAINFGLTVMIYQYRNHLWRSWPRLRTHTAPRPVAQKVYK